LEREHPVDALQVTLEDVIRAAELALSHRRRDRQASSEPSGEGIAERARERLQQMDAPAQSSESEVGTEEGESTPSSSGGERGEGTARQSPDHAEPKDAALAQPEVRFDGQTFPVRRIQLPRDRRTRRTPGKRSLTRSGDKRGRYVRSEQVEKTIDLAFDATLRAAAPHQPTRREAARVDAGPSLLLEAQDLRQKVRQRKTGTLIVFVVDASASMDAEQRMVATKGAVLSLLRDAYVRRDKVALIVFSGRSARVVLRPTASVDLAEARLERLGVGGTTPLTHGLVAGLKLIHTERLRDPSVYPLLVLISDGRGNISLFGEEPLVEAQRVAAQIKAEHIRALVIDSARDYTQHLQLPRIGGQPRQPLFGGYAFNACLDLAERLGGKYYGLYDLSQGAIVRSVEQSLRSS
jgi:magnesium chelatase subunit D